LSNKKLDLKKKKPTEEATERLAKIFIKQIDSKRNKKQEYVIFSVIGAHAGESRQEIFRRKIKDINRVGHTFWLFKSNQAKPNIVQCFCKRAKKKDRNVFCVFIEPSTPSGAKPTKINTLAESYSVDNKKWSILPKGLSSVTGKIGKGAYALIFDSLRRVNGEVNLWEYADFLTEKTIKIRLGNSTLCAVRKNTAEETDKIKSPNRRIIAMGKLHEPYCVWLK